MTGGVLVSAANEDLRSQGHDGILRLLYEVSPLAFIVEQAGGLASTGATRVLERLPTGLHERSSAVMGSKDEVQVFVEKYQKGT
jgi:fructose-1,6-bisphosphatase I